LGDALQHWDAQSEFEAELVHNPDEYSTSFHRGRALIST
jgi:hypothetical protein